MDDEEMPAIMTSKQGGMNRAAIERFYKIHEKVLAGELPNCSTLAREFETSAKMIQRDITFMQDRLNLPFEYYKSCHGYRYTADVSEFPLFEFKAADLAGLFLAHQALDSVRGTKMEQTMAEVFSKFTSAIEGQVNFSWA